MKLYVKSNSFDGYLYIFKHGLGPGTIPKDVAIVKEKDLPNGYTAVWLDRFLRTSELDAYDIPSETEINRYLDRIGYCQKNGDVVPCDEVEACDTVNAAKSSKASILDSYVGKDTWLKAKLSQKAYFRRGYTGDEYWIRIVDKDEDGDYVINRVSSYKDYNGNSAQKQRTLSNTYTVDKNSITLFNPIQTATTDEIFNVKACDKVTASTKIPEDADLPTFKEFATSEWEILNDGSERLKLKDLFVYFGTDKQWNASDPGYWYEIKIGDKTYKESKKYSINNRERCYKAMQRDVSELLQSDDIKSCDAVEASDYRYSAGRVEEDGTEDFYYDTGFDSYDEACDWGINHDCTHIYDREKDEFTPINSCDTKYFANMVSASSDSYRYIIRGYYDQSRRGLAEDSWAATISEVDEIVNEYANKGYYLEVRNLETGTVLEFSADNWFDEIYPDGGFSAIPGAID